MNTYNENLHASVVTSLQVQQLGLKNLQAALDASIVTLYYAEGARITSTQQVDLATAEYKASQAIRTQAVRNNNIAINLNACANEQKTETALTVSNISVCAANTQVAANAVLRLAGDVGNILNMAQAADFDSEIYQQSMDANVVITDTAYLAEAASQMAMEASYIAAEIAAVTLAANAKTTADQVANILTVTTADFDALTKDVATKDAAMAQASDAEKLAEGVVEYENAEYFAARYAYVLNNKELNLNLGVVFNKAEKTVYTVHFDSYMAPFKMKIKNSDPNAVLDMEKPLAYPVKDYYIMLVKEAKQPIFSISDAEALLLNKGQYVKIAARPGSERISYQKEIEINQLNDSDGDPMQLGKNYVIFVLAVFDDVYKKAINTFDDYLTASSEKFRLFNDLESPAPNNIIVPKPGTLLPTLYFFLFEERDYKVEYRAMFLPDNSGQNLGQLTSNGLRNLEDEVHAIAHIEDEDMVKIDVLNMQIDTLTSDRTALVTEREEAVKERDKARNPKDKKKYEDEIHELDRRIKEIDGKLIELQKELAKIEKDMDGSIKNLFRSSPEQPGFFFNLKLAEQVSTGNYTNTTQINNNKTDLPVEVRALVTATIVPEGKQLRVFKAEIPDNTTDNFGNRLIDGREYVPAILSLSTDEDPTQFLNSLSAFSFTPPFIYSSHLNTN